MKIFSFQMEKRFNKFIQKFLGDGQFHMKKSYFPLQSQSMVDQSQCLPYTYISKNYQLPGAKSGYMYGTKLSKQKMFVLLTHWITLKNVKVILLGH